MQENSSSATDTLKAGNRIVAFGIAGIVGILLGAAVLLFIVSLMVGRIEGSTSPEALCPFGGLETLHDACGEAGPIAREMQPHTVLAKAGYFT